MFSSLALIVGAAAVKFGGKRPNFVQLLEWAWEAISASFSAGPPSSLVR